MFKKNCYIVDQVVHVDVTLLNITLVGSFITIYEIFYIL